MPRAMTQKEFEERVKQYTKDTVKVISQYVNKKTKVRVKCKVCGYEWEVSPMSFMPSTTSKYNFNGCQNCKYEEVECTYCHKKIRKLKTEIQKNKSGYNYCSRECGNRHKNFLLTDTNDGTNYRRNAFLYYEHKCDICGWNADERVLEVHHLDENRKNNKINNLRILCPICHKKLTLHLYTYEELKKEKRNESRKN